MQLIAYAVAEVPWTRMLKVNLLYTLSQEYFSMCNISLSAYFTKALLLAAFHLEALQIMLCCLLQFKINFMNSEFCSHLVELIGRGIGLFETLIVQNSTTQANADIHPLFDLNSKSRTSDQRWTVNFTS